MSLSIGVVSEKCILCGKCVKVCPSMIFELSKDNKSIQVSNIDSCINCGHCMGVCPSGAVVHSTFPQEKVHKIDYSIYPTSEQLMMLIKSRRSNRAMSNAVIPKESLQMILEAAHRAPTASNSQKVFFKLIENPDDLKYISDFTIKTFEKLIKLLQTPILKLILKRIMPEAYKYLPAFNRFKIEHEKGNDLIIRKAKAVLLIYTPKSNRFGKEDANLAYQNGSLMAESLGVAQFYLGFVCSALSQDKKRVFNKRFGIDGTIHAAMGLGMPLFKYENFTDRNDIGPIS